MEPVATGEAAASALQAALDEADDATYRDNVTAEAMKAYEALYRPTVPADKPFVIRLDGHRFSKFTKGFKRPYDERIAVAMHRTTADLLSYFSCRLAYTQSDEITLVFAVPEHPYNGIVQKIATLASGYGTARFIAHMSAQVFGPSETELKERVGFAHFDARVFAVPSMSEALRNVWWRQNDCKCNSKLNLGAANLKQRELENLSPAQIVRKLRAEKGLEWRDMPGPYKWGAFLKKGKVLKEGFNPKTGEHIPAVERSVMMLASFSIGETTTDMSASDGVTPRNEALVAAKFANEAAHLFPEFKPFEH